MDTEKLFRQTLEKPNAESFMLLMLYATSQLHSGICFPKGIGFTISTLRGAGRLGNIAMLEEITTALNLPRIQNGERFISYVFEQCVENSPGESMRLELIKAAISLDPKLPLFALSPMENIAITPSAPTDLDRWLEHETNADPNLFRRSLAVLALCERLAPDIMAPYWPKARMSVLEGLQKQLEYATELVERSLFRECLELLRSLIRTPSLGRYLGRIKQEWIPEARSLVANYFYRFKKGAPEPILGALKGIHDDLRAHHVPDVLRPLETEEQEPLVLTFQLADYSDVHRYKQTTYPRPPLTMFVIYVCLRAWKSTTRPASSL